MRQSTIALQETCSLEKVQQFLNSVARNSQKSRAVINRCDICNDHLIQCQDEMEKIDMLDEIDNSYENEHDKHEPRLLLCSYCTKEYQIPGYPI